MNTACLPPPVLPSPERARPRAQQLPPAWNAWNSPSPPARLPPGDGNPAPGGSDPAFGRVARRGSESTNPALCDALLILSGIYVQLFPNLFICNNLHDTSAQPPKTCALLMPFKRRITQPVMATQLMYWPLGARAAFWSAAACPPKLCDGGPSAAFRGPTPEPPLCIGPIHPRFFPEHSPPSWMLWTSSIHQHQHRRILRGFDHVLKFPVRRDRRFEPVVHPRPRLRWGWRAAPSPSPSAASGDGTIRVWCVVR